MIINTHSRRKNVMSIQDDINSAVSYFNYQSDMDSLPGKALKSGYKADLWVLPDVGVLGVERNLVSSKLAGGDVSCFVILPPSYSKESNRRYPTIYWLHGSGGLSPIAIRQLSRLYSDAMLSRKLSEVIIVLPNGLPMGMWCDWKDGSVKNESMLITEIIPSIDEKYRTLSKPDKRIIEGFSMGGYGAARIGFKHHQLFAGVSILGGGPLQPELIETPRAGPIRRDLVMDTVFGGDSKFFHESSPWELAEKNVSVLRKGRKIRQVVGGNDETLGFNRAFHKHLEKLKIGHSYKEVTGVPHNPMQLLKAMGDENWDFYRRIIGK